MVYSKNKRCNQVVIRHVRQFFYCCTFFLCTVTKQHLSQQTNCTGLHLHLSEHFEDFLGKLV